MNSLAKKDIDEFYMFHSQKAIRLFACSCLMKKKKKVARIEERYITRDDSFMLIIFTLKIELYYFKKLRALNLPNGSKDPL